MPARKPNPPPDAVREDEHGDLFLAALNEYDAPYKVVLDKSQAALWDAYVEACRAQQRAAQEVRAALRQPTAAEIRKVAIAAESPDPAEAKS